MRDLTNKKFNRLTALKFVKRENNKSKWLFKCECGKEKILAMENVVHGSTKSCGCLRVEHGKKHIQIIKNLTKVRLRKEKNGKLFCPRCKEYKEKSDFYKCTKDFRGVMSYCKICHYVDMKKRINLSENCYKRMWYLIRYSAKKRNLAFDFTKQEFFNWFNPIEKSCEYCGIKQEVLNLLKWGNHKRDAEFRYLGIDRKDSNIGYTNENIVLCCSVCNAIKNSVLSYEEMKEIAIKYIRPKWEKIGIFGWDKEVVWYGLPKGFVN